jgi:DNA-binding LytR/AlgR family response regulator
MKILILEDEERTARTTITLLSQHHTEAQVLAIIPSVSKAAQWLANNPSPDLILTDIHLEDSLVFKLFEEVNITCPVIFITAFNEYMIHAFKVNGIDYLLKPLQSEALISALHKYKTLQSHFSDVNYRAILKNIDLQKSPEYKDRFMITAGTKLFTVEAGDIAYFILDAKVTHLVTHKGQKFVVNYSLDDLAELLDPKVFFRINRQCLASINSIDNASHFSTGKLKVKLNPTSDEELFVSGDRVPRFKEWLGK